MKKMIVQMIVLPAILILAVICDYLIPYGYSSSQPTAKSAAAETIKPVSSGKAHSVIYRVRESRPGQAPVEKLILRSVNENGEWRKEVIWPMQGATVENRIDGKYSVSSGSKSLLSSNGIGAGNYFQPIPEKIRQTAEVKEICGIKAYMTHNEGGGLILDEAFAEETGMTPLWSHIVNRNSGYEIVSEALHVIWGAKRF